MLTMDEDRMERIVILRARFLSWKLGRRVLHPDTRESHWWHMPTVFENGTPVTAAREE